ncbi:MAG: DUF2459 domain-containing protein [Bacteroidota bacterium]
MIKKILRGIGKVMLGLLGLILLYFLSAILLSYIPTNTKNLKCVKDCTLYASTNGIHADLILPVEQLPNNLKEQLNLKPSDAFVGFGWGDKKFYLETPTWKDLKCSTALKAMFWKSETAMHVTYYRRASKNWKGLEICTNQNEKLNDAILRSFKKQEGENIIWTAEGYGQYDEFYEAEGSYSCFKTCNTWVNQALKKAKIKTPIWSPFDWGILGYFE